MYTGVFWFLVICTKTNHSTLILNTDLENSGKTTLEKWKNCFYHNFSLKYSSVKFFSEGNTCPILMFEYSFQSLGPPLQESVLKLSLGGL